MSQITDILRERIAAAPGGVISFAEVMRLALYHPQHGYYGPGPRRLGRGGDFFTAVSTGRLYGRLLAMLAEKVWHALGSPPDFTIAEQGAHDGQLMADVFEGLASIGSPLAASASFLIIEPNANYQQAQHGRLGRELGGRLSWAPTPDALPSHLFLYANELLDAMPVHRVRWTGCVWVEEGVGLSGDGSSFVWRDLPLPAAGSLTDEAALLPANLSPGHTTEIGLDAVDWMRSLNRAAFKGAVLIADYGLEGDELVAPERAGGTLRRYHQHQMDDKVLSALGECDLTAHVHFTRLLDVADEGFPFSKCADQGRFLTPLAEPWLRSLEGRAPSPADAALLRQFQTLTHPGHMGAKFRLCLLGRGMDRTAWQSVV